MTQQPFQAVPLGTDETTLPPTFEDLPTLIVENPTVAPTYDPNANNSANWLSTNNPS